MLKSNSDSFHDLLKQLEEQTAISQELLRKYSILEADSKSRAQITDKFVLISETDTRGIITYANPRFCEVSGYTLDELLGKPHNIVRHPDTSKEVFKELWQTIKSGKIWQGEIKNLRKDGTHYWVLATVGPIFDDKGEILSYVSMRVDITAQKDLELALQKEKNQLREALESLWPNLRVAHDTQTSLMPPLETPENFNLPYFILWQPMDMPPGTRLHLYTDGVQDQKRNESEKRWGQKQWRDYLTSLQNYSLFEQKDIINKEFSKCKLEGRQTDDMTLVAIEIP